jgi:HlyD family secretion protein
MRTWLTGSVVIVLAGGVIAWAVFGDSEGEFEIVTTTVVSAPITMTIETSGTVEPLSTVQVGCEVTGKIVELSVDDDEPVKKGQVICRIDPELATAENMQSQADHIKAQSALASAKLSLGEQTANLPVLTKQALARKQESEAVLGETQYQWQRTDKLYAEDNATETEWVLRKSAWQRAKSATTAAEAAHEMAVNNEKFVLQRTAEAVAQAEATLNLAEARRNFTRARVERCTITSPIDGIVLKRYQDVGTTVVSTFQPPLLFLLAPSLDRMRVRAKVSESDVYHVIVGQPARFTIEARQPIQFEGRLLHKHNQPDIVQNVVTYMVDFEVDNDEQRTLIPGLSVNVEIECVSKQDVPLISNAALRFKPPLTLQERSTLIDAAQWPEKPAFDVHGQEAFYSSKATAWRYDTRQRSWEAVPLWVGVTDNINTEILAGAEPGDLFARKFIDKSKSGFSFKEALKLASPDNRRL